MRCSLRFRREGRVVLQSQVTKLQRQSEQALRALHAAVAASQPRAR